MQVSVEVGSQALTEAHLLELVCLAPDHPRWQVESWQTIGNCDRVGGVQSGHLGHERRGRPVRDIGLPMHADRLPGDVAAVWPLRNNCTKEG